MKVKLEDIIEAIEFTSDDIEYFLDQETGEIVMISDMTMTSEEKEAACEALDEHGFYRLPTQRELRDYDTMEAFVDNLSCPAQERLATAISGRGAFRRFKTRCGGWGLRMNGTPGTKTHIGGRRLSGARRMGLSMNRQGEMRT